MQLTRKTLSLAFLGALAAVAYAARSVTQLTENGQVVSSHLVLMNGQLMVPVRDIATYFGYNLKVANGIAELSKPGLAQPIVSPGEPALPGATVPAPLTQTPVTPPSVTVPVPAQPGTYPSTVPSTVIPGTAVTTANVGLFPSFTAPPPLALSGAVGVPTSFNGFDYRVDSVVDAGPRYRTVFDQRHETLRAPWKTDKLVVATLTVTNRGQQAVYPPTPGSYGMTVFDDQKIGYPGIGVDRRQAGDVNSVVDSNDIAPLASGSDLLLGPGGQMQYAIVASIPQDRQVAQIVLNLPAGTGASEAAGGATVTVKVR